jgi:anti-sigma B factor antagonist
MDLVIREEDHGGVPVLSLAGEIDLATAPRLRDRLVRVATVHQGETVLVDLDGVTLLDSAGLGVLLGGLRRMRTGGGDLVIVCASSRLGEIFHSVDLDRVFSIHSTLAGAMSHGR